MASDTRQVKGLRCAATSDTLSFRVAHLLRKPALSQARLQTPTMLPFLQENWQFLAVGAGVFIIAMLAFASLREGPMPYQKRGGLLTPAEITFLRSLQVAVREEWLIFSMVRLADIIQVRPKTPKSRAWFGRIIGKHIDFVLCDPETLEVKVAIELDDSSHQHDDRIVRDRFVNTAMAAAGIPLIRVKVEAKYEHAQIRKEIEEALGIIRKKKRA